MGASDVYWSISNSEILSTSWTIETLNWDFKSDEIDPEMILLAPIQVEPKEIELKVHIKGDEMISDAESVVGDFPATKVVVMEDTEEGPQRGFTFGGIL